MRFYGLVVPPDSGNAFSLDEEGNLWSGPVNADGSVGGIDPEGEWVCLDELGIVDAELDKERGENFKALCDLARKMLLAGLPGEGV